MAPKPSGLKSEDGVDRARRCHFRWAKDTTSSAEVLKPWFELGIQPGNWVEGLMGEVGEVPGKLNK